MGDFWMDRWGVEMVAIPGSPNSYWRGLPDHKLKINEPIYEQLSREMIHGDYGRWRPIEEFVASLEAISKGAPEDCPVLVSYDKESDYEGGYYYYFEVGYERPPTEEEKAERKVVNKRIAERDRALADYAAEQERAEFERLRAKFEA